MAAVSLEKSRKRGHAGGGGGETQREPKVLKQEPSRGDEAKPKSELRRAAPRHGVEVAELLRRDLTQRQMQVARTEQLRKEAKERQMQPESGWRRVAPRHGVEIAELLRKEEAERQVQAARAEQRREQEKGQMLAARIARFGGLVRSKRKASRVDEKVVRPLDAAPFAGGQFEPPQQGESATPPPESGFQIAMPMHTAGKRDREEDAEKCWLLNAVSKLPCDTELSMEQYLKLTRAPMYVSSSPFSKMRVPFSELNSLMVAIAERAGGVCFGGRIRLLVEGDPYGDDQEVMDQAGEWNVDVDRPACRNARLIYMPLQAFWVPRGSDAAAQARHERQEYLPQGDGHAMALLLDPGRKTAEFFEPNGNSVPWHRPLYQYLKHAVKSRLGYDLMPQMCIYSGYQSRSGLNMCEFFSSFYAAMRLTCRAGASAIQEYLFSLEMPALVRLMKQWQCYLLRLTSETGTADAVQQLPDSLGKLAVMLRYFGVLDSVGALTEADRAELDRATHEVRALERIAPYNVVLADQQARSLSDALDSYFSNRSSTDAVTTSM